MKAITRFLAKRADKKWIQYCKRMQEIEEKFIIDNKLEMNKRYSAEYFLGGTFEGELWALDSASDGLFCVLKLDNGKMKPDCLAITLKKI